jgi:hypothetical protein
MHTWATFGPSTGAVVRLAALLLLICICGCSGAATGGTPGGQGGAHDDAGASTGPLTPANGTGGNAAGGAGPGGGGEAGSGAGAGGATASGGAAVSGGSGGAGDTPSFPVEITLTAYGANGTVGLEWSEVPGASAYTVNFATAPGALNGGQSFTADRPGVVHRGLTNGTTYHYVVTAVTEAGAPVASNEAAATPNGEWVLEQLGTGSFDDVVTGGKTQVPMAERLHVLMFPEGYTEADLSIFRGDPADGDDRTSDVRRWIDLVFGIEPYALFPEAFVIWILPRASATRIDGGDTAFRVPVMNTSGSWATASIPTDGETASRAWAAVNTHPFPPTATGSGGLGTLLNFTAAFLILNPSTNRAGLSGRALSLRDPADSSRRLSSGFGVGHAHEFTHAFSGVRDEYMEEAFRDRTWTNSPTSNVVGTNVCAELPWAHLLAGAGIHDTEELVGGFGVPEIGIHSELLCLMNGTHHNGTYYARDDSGSCTPERCTLRAEDRMCNHCREITAFRVFERSGLVPGHATWASEYRGVFYERFGFQVPAIVPQSNDRNNPANGTPIYEECVEEAPFQLMSVSPAPPPAAGPHYEGCVLEEP